MNSDTPEKSDLMTPQVRQLSFPANVFSLPLFNIQVDKCSTFSFYVTNISKLFFTN